MANSLFIPNNYLVIPPPRVSASFSSKPIAPQPLLGFSVTNSSPIVLHSRSSSRRASSFKSHLSARGSVPPVNAKEDNVDSSGADQQHLPSLRTLLKVYKDAIFNEDEKTVSEIEARMEVIETKQNELVQKVSSISAEVTSGKEKLIRLQADFDNCRKRFEKERLTVRTDAQGEVIESLLPMVDNFERAKQQIRPETEKEKKIDTSYQGIYKQFVEIMRSLRVASVPTKGKPFDPSVHEAIAREESQEFPEGIVIQEIRRGFLLGGRLLRPAMVKVSIGPGSKKSPVATEKSSGSPATTASVEN
ncbi:protein GrpE [Rosa sericea]